MKVIRNCLWPPIFICRLQEANEEVPFSAERSVIVCERDNLQRQLLCDVIEMLDHKSNSCDNLEQMLQGDQGLAAIVDCDLLISEEALQQLQAFKGMPVNIAASSSAGRWMNIAADNSWQFLTKPYRIAEIQKILTSYEED